MFDHIVLRRSEDGTPVTAGLIAESLIYYQKVHVVFDDSTLFNLINQIGLESTLRLLALPDLSAVYTDETLATQTQMYGVTPCYNLIAIEYLGDDNRRVERAADKIAYRLEKRGTSKTAARNFATKFFSKVPAKNYSGNYFIKGGIIEAAKLDLENKPFIEESFKEALKVIPGSYPIENIELKTTKSDLGYFFFTDIDWDRINRNRAALNIPNLEPIGVADILCRILDAQADLNLSAHYGGDFHTSEVTSRIIRIRHSHLLSRSKINAEAIDQFNEITLPNLPSISEVVDSGERGIEEFIKLYDKSSRFKKWIKGTNPDEGMIKSYLDEVTKVDAAQKLPAKILRYVLATTADTLDPILGKAVGFADNFLVDKYLRGWRPNHFITEKLHPFLRAED